VNKVLGQHGILVQWESRPGICWVSRSLQFAY